MDNGCRISRRDPIQTTDTTYTYNADSQPVTVTDARGVTQTFTYNNRELPTNISYSGWQPLTAVSIAYDGAGNRTSMTDGTGTKTRPEQSAFSIDFGDAPIHRVERKVHDYL